MNQDPASTAGPCRDDPAIGDGELLWRLVTIIGDGPDGAARPRPTSGSFRDRHGMLSVNRAKLSTVERTLWIQPDNQIAEFTAADVREFSYKIYADPVYVCLHCRRDIGAEPTACPNCGYGGPFYHNLAHAVVCPKISDSAARKIAKEQAKVITVSPEVRERARNVNILAL